MYTEYFKLQVNLNSAFPLGSVITVHFLVVLYPLVYYMYIAI